MSQGRKRERGGVGGFCSNVALQEMKLHPEQGEEGGTLRRVGLEVTEPLKPSRG